jgi:hypothetical protein
LNIKLIIDRLLLFFLDQLTMLVVHLHTYVLMDLPSDTHRAWENDNLVVRKVQLLGVGGINVSGIIFCSLTSQIVVCNSEQVVGYIKK